MDSWHVLLEILILLGSALLLGTLAEQLRQSAILGYLLAGTLVGPNVLKWIESPDSVEVIAELGVALLLFTIGLEFSFRRLRRLGKVALLGGTLQITVTLLVAAAVSMAAGLTWRPAVCVGAMIALSSTACVLRLLIDRAELESLYGRNALGILLMQDVAVIPLMLLVATLGSEGSLGEAVTNAGMTLLLGGGLVIVFVLLLKFIIPRLLAMPMWVRNRDQPIVLAIVVAIGAAWASHGIGVSPAMGAFVAGVILGESPFAVQIRADVSPLRALLVTLFFASVGMLGDPAWAAANLPQVSAVVVAIVVGKAAIIWVIVRSMGVTHGVAAATGICLAQVGEFSFVLAKVTREGLGESFDHVFNLVVTATIITLFLTPFLINAAPRLADLIEAKRAARRRRRRARTKTGDEPGAAEAGSPAGDSEEEGEAPPDIFIIGFGPAGQRVAQAMLDHYAHRLKIIELNPRNAALATRWELAVQIGDARQAEVLEHADLHHARIIITTIPDPAGARLIIHQCRTLAPNATVVARARYHVLQGELHMAGADDVVDEESEVGSRLAATARRHLIQE